MGLFILQSQGIKVVAVGIGSNINTYELLNMAFDSSHAFTSNSFDTLNSLQKSIKDEACGSKYINRFFAYCKGATLIFISRRGSAISSAKQWKLGSINSLVKN